MSDTPPCLQVLPLGAGGAFTRNDFHTNLLLLCGETRCLVDCADPIHRVLHEQTARAGVHVSRREIEHILITHLHPDHCSGLESLLLHRRFVLDAEPPVVYVLPEVAEVLWSDKFAASMERSLVPEIGMDEHYTAEDFYRLQVVDEDKPFDIGPMRFEVHRARHSLPTYGFRVQAGGRSFGYSCDTIFFPEHIEFLAEADLIFHEITPSPIHTNYEELLALPSKIRDKMRLVHMPDKFDRAASEIPCVEAGVLYTP